MSDSEKIWFTSDTHFGHLKLALDFRGFTSVAHHDDRLITLWNMRVGPKDIVYHLGDVGLCKPRALRDILDRLNGRIRLIRGNHEKSADHPLCRDRFEWIKDVYEMRRPDGGKIWLSHYAHLTWPSSHYGAWHLFGHSHGSIGDRPGWVAMDVGVDAWQLAPVAYEEVERVMADRKFVPVDHHVGNN